MKGKIAPCGRASFAAACTLGITLLGFAVARSQALQPAQPGQATACPGDLGGITLSPGFCATVFADKLGHVRQMAVAPNGILYANSWSGRYYNDDTPPPGGMLIALQDSKGNGTADKVVRFGRTFAEGDHGGTGIALYNGYLYAETNDRIVRYRIAPSGITPTGKEETVVSGLPLSGDHPMHPIRIDAKGNMYMDSGAATNSCQSENRMPNVMGLNPCTELRTRAGIWRYDANTLNQRFSAAERFATGLRNGEAVSWDSAGRMFATQHGRDQLSQNFPRLYTALQGANEPAEELVPLVQGGDYGWPECYYDFDQKKLVLAPEYGGDGGRKIGVCAQKLAPVAAFPGHWAPNDMLIYEGGQFPAAYRNGAFIAFHGSWNRAPLPQQGYNVVFQPLADGKASGPFVVFADGFAGAYREPGRALHRPTGLAVAPDGSLYISDDVGGRIWRVTYQGGNKASGIAGAAPTLANGQVAAARVSPPEGVHPDAGLPIPPGGSPDQVALGDRIFHGQAAGGTCAGCHGSDGKGSVVGSDLVGGHWLWGNGSVQAIEHTIETGVPKPKDHTGSMPPRGGAPLTAGEVAAVTDYVWAISHRGGQ